MKRRSARRANPGARPEWTTKYQWPVTRAAGSDLVFSLRVPPVTRVIDLGGPAPAEVTTAAERLRSALRAPGRLICAAAFVARANPADLGATLTASLVEGVRGVPDPEELGARVDGETLRRTVRPIGEKVVVIDQLSRLPSPDDEPVAMLLIQYLLPTRYGAMSLAFTTSDAGIITETGRGVFFDIAATTWIGEAELPDGLEVSSARWSP